MNRVLTLQKHKQTPTDHFGRAAALVESKAVLVPCVFDGSRDLRDGYRIDAINRTFEEGDRPYGISAEDMFSLLYTLMHQVQEETAAREMTEARDRLLAVATGLSEEALAAIRKIEVSECPDLLPSDAVLRFTAFADDKRRDRDVRGKKRLHEADILPFTPPARDL